MRAPPASESSQTVAEVRESLLASCCSRCVPPLKKKSSFVHCSGGSRVARERRIFVNINDDFLRIAIGHFSDGYPVSPIFRESCCSSFQLYCLRFSCV